MSWFQTDSVVFDHRRLRDKQHIALVLGMGGLTPCQEIVDAILTPQNDEQRSVMDIGMVELFFLFFFYD